MLMSSKCSLLNTFKQTYEQAFKTLATLLIVIFPRKALKWKNIMRNKQLCLSLFFLKKKIIFTYLHTHTHNFTMKHFIIKRRYQSLFILKSCDYL